MSIAMIAMSWALTGGPSTASGGLQIVVFGVFAVWFLARLARPAAGRARVTEGYHLGTNAAMVWMVAAMPQLMGTAMAAMGGHHDQSGDGMAAVPGMPGMRGMAGFGGGPMSASTPVWATVGSWVFIVLLGAAVVFWATRIARPGGANGRAPATEVTGESLSGSATGSPSADGPSSEGAARSGTGGAVALAPPATRTRSTGPRLDAGCHLLMSLGMAGMLLAML